jgi:hypothetical protein
MTRNRRPRRPVFGTPAALVLYRTADRWRYALFFAAPGGVADGALDQPPPTASPEAAQAACLRKAEEFTGARLTVVWRAADDPGWWTGSVQNAEPAGG